MKVPYTLNEENQLPHLNSLNNLKAEQLFCTYSGV